jgi:hypothetical protein
MRREPSQGPTPFPTVSPTHNLPTFASGFLFLSNKQKIITCNWASGCGKVGLSIEVTDGDPSGGPGQSTQPMSQCWPRVNKSINLALAQPLQRTGWDNLSPLQVLTLPASPSRKS